MTNSSVGIDNEKINVWLKNNVIEKLAEILKQPHENFVWDLSVPENCFFLSCVLFMNLYVNGKNKSNSKKCEDECTQLVIKKPGDFMSNCTLFPTSSLFHNEILFYKYVSSKNNDYPRCFYYSEDKKDLNNMVIIMENIAIKGYEVCPYNYDIPFEYIISGMETIGKFHAMGYALKEKKPEIFFKIIKDIEESRFFPGDQFNKYINLISMRPVEWLRKQNYDKQFVDLMENHMSNAFDNVMMDAIAPVEPLAVLCHGDFTRNNIFFKKTPKKMESMLIDFAMLRYSSPSIDISTFLYLSCSNYNRRERFNEIFEAYHTSLIKNLRKEGIDDVEKYSYEKMLKDYKRRAMHGFIIALFFIPILRGFSSFTQDDASNFDAVKLGRKCKEEGGDALSKEFGEILLELRDTGCLDHLINP